MSVAIMYTIINISIHTSIVMYVITMKNKYTIIILVVVAMMIVAIMTTVITMIVVITIVVVMTVVTMMEAMVAGAQMEVDRTAEDHIKVYLMTMWTNTIKNICFGTFVLNFERTDKECGLHYISK